jgi:hypothetical protein
MWNTPTEKDLAKIPNLYESENISMKDKLIHLHFFIMGSDWYIAEYNGKDLFWGFVILNEDYEMAEWGFISFAEMKEIIVEPGIEIECELGWQIKKACEIEKITRAQGY